MNNQKLNNDILVNRELMNNFGETNGKELDFVED